MIRRLEGVHCAKKAGLGGGVGGGSDKRRQKGRAQENLVPSGRPCHSTVGPALLKPSDRGEARRTQRLARTVWARESECQTRRKRRRSTGALHPCPARLPGSLRPPPENVNPAAMAKVSNTSQIGRPVPANQKVSFNEV